MPRLILHTTAPVGDKIQSVSIDKLVLQLTNITLLRTLEYLQLVSVPNVKFP